MAGVALMLITPRVAIVTNQSMVSGPNNRPMLPVP